MQNPESSTIDIAGVTCQAGKCKVACVGVSGTVYQTCAGRQLMPFHHDDTLFSPGTPVTTLHFKLLCRLSRRAGSQTQ